MKLDDAIAMAEKSPKKILLSVTAEWCGYCKKMDREVYGQQVVADLIDEHFYPAYIDTDSKNEVNFMGETYTEQELAWAFRITGTPTTIFLSAEGKPLGVQPGFIPGDVFKKLVSFVGTDSFKSMSFDEYEPSSK